MLFVYLHIKYKVVINTSNFDKDVRQHMTHMTVLAIIENMRYGDVRKEIPNNLKTFKIWECARRLRNRKYFTILNISR